jgi:aspartate aminotransferase
MPDRPAARVIENLVQALGPVLWFFRESTWAKQQGNPDPSVCDFVAGNPHDVPLPEIVDAIQKWSVPKANDWFAYKMEDIPAQTAAAAALSDDHGLTYDPLDVTLTPGTFGALSIAMRTVLDPGDEVVFISPPWFFYEAMIIVTGATPVRVTSEGPEFELPLDAIATAITPKTRAIIVNSPNNPSGRIYPPADLERLAAILKTASEKNGRTIYLLSDESYRRILFDGNTFTSPAASYDATMVLYTYGKQLLAPGQRLGYVALTPTMPDRELLREAVTLSRIVGGWQVPNNVMAYALPEIEHVTIDLAHLQERRDRVVKTLTELGYELNTPESTFYIMAKSPIPDDIEFTEILASHNVFVGPGKIFELPGYFRLSITANDDMIDRSFPGFEKALAQASG